MRNLEQPLPKTAKQMKVVFWRQHGKLLIGGGIILAILISVGVTVAIVFSDRQKTTENVKVFPEYTKQEALTQQLSTGAPSVECEKFHELSRGWHGPDIIPNNTFRQRFKKIIEEEIRESEDQAIKDAKYFYNFCMDEDSLEKYGLESVKGVIKNMGGWPMMNLTSNNHNCYPKSFCLDDRQLPNLRQRKLSAWTVPHPVRKIYYMKVSQVKMKESNEQCNETYENRKDSVCRNMEHIAKSFGVKDIDFRTHCNDVIIDIGQHCKYVLEMENWKDAFTTINQIKTFYIGEEREKFILNSIPESGENNDPRETYIGLSRTGLSLLRELETVDESERKLNENMWTFVTGFKFFLPKYISGNLSLHMPLDTLEHEEAQLRWEGCVDEILTAYPLTSQNLYRRKYYHSKIQAGVRKIFDDVKHGFNHILPKMLWMNNRTRSAAIQRLEAITLYIPKPPKDLPEPLTINKTNPIQTVLDMQYLKYFRNLSYLYEVFDEEDAEFAKIDKNNPAPHYMARMNTIYIPVETLHMYFDNGRPDYLNYVALGFTIARQIALGFHLQWFGNIQEYSKRVDCFSNLLLNGSVVIEKYEREAFKKIMTDYMGLRTAYAAYVMSLTRNSDSAYNNRQIFWMAAEKLSFSEHSHVLKLIPHLKEFHSDFDCQIGSTMHPNHTCSLD